MNKLNNNNNKRPLTPKSMPPAGKLNITFKMRPWFLVVMARGVCLPCPSWTDGGSTAQFASTRVAGLPSLPVSLPFFFTICAEVTLVSLPEAPFGWWDSPSRSWVSPAWGRG